MYLARSLSIIRSLSNSFTDLTTSNSRSSSSSSAVLPYSNNSLALTPFDNYRMHITKDREKADNALFEHVRKAVNSDETAPKQKHVRGKFVNFDFDLL